MNQVSPKFRREERGYAHYCPGCREMHVLPDSWQFNGNLDRPTFTPSFKHSGVQSVVDNRGEWTGDLVRGPDGRPLPYCCHYILTDGILKFCDDCTHALRGKHVELPTLPWWAQDNPEVAVSYTLAYVAKLVGSNGDTFTFSGQQGIGAAAPQASDFATATAAMQADIQNQLVTGYPIQNADDSDNPSAGGQG